MAWAYRSFPLFRFYAPRAHGVPGVVAQRRPAGRVFATAPHEPGGGCLVPRSVAGRGDRLSDLRHVAGGDGGGRLYRRAGGGDAVRPGEPPHAAERGRQLRRVLSGLTGAGGHAGLAARFQRGSAARAVRFDPGGGCAGDADGRSDRLGFAAGAGGAVPCISDRVLRRHVPARQRAAPVGADPRPVSGAGGGQSGGGIPDPRHSDVGGADDAARRQRALLGAQSAADAGDGDGHRRAFQPDWVGVVLLRFAARRPGDRAQRQRHLFRLDPVWNAWRHLRLRAPLRSAICKEKV